MKGALKAFANEMGDVIQDVADDSDAGEGR
jgi:hypothetical protein